VDCIAIEVIPNVAVIPVEQYHNRVCEPVVSVGDNVLTGDVIARSREAGLPPVHASISGTVSEIGMRSHPF
jgi:electron transport complex protein RnfC